MFLSLFTLECSPQEINSWEIRLHLTYSANWNNAFATVAVVDAKAPHSGSLWQPQRQTIGIGLPPTQITGDEA